jgi:predicted metal-dependent hydrolase
MFSYVSGNIAIDYTFEARPNIQEITVHVCPNNGVKLVVPKSLNESNRQFIISKKAEWILEKLGSPKQMEKKKEQPAKASEKPASAPQEKLSSPSFADGDKIPYLGRSYRLNIVKEKREDASLTFRAKFIASLPESWSDSQINEGIRMLLTDWFANRADSKFQECLKTLTKQTGDLSINMKSADLKQQTHRVQEDGTIVLNWRLLAAPLTVIEFVLGREMSKQTNQDGDQWFEDVSERQQWLEENELTVF